MTEEKIQHYMHLIDRHGGGPVLRDLIEENERLKCRLGITLAPAKRKTNGTRYGPGCK